MQVASCSKINELYFSVAIFETFIFRSIYSTSISNYTTYYQPLTINYLTMEPLASSLRPKTLKDYIGQKHLVGPGKPLAVAIEKKHLFSFVLYGPPGSGKTTLARIYANAINADYHELSAVSAGKDDIRCIVGTGGELFGPRVLFLDEIHRFNKAQQDFLLPHVESGRLILIGATTENPSFEVIPALLSRCRVFVLNELTKDDMKEILARVGGVEGEALDMLIEIGGGDARQTLGLLESTRELYGTITVETIKNALQSKFLRYDKKGEEHYNTISAFIKSMRASQVDAALYYLSRMIASGEDPKFIARRMVIFASEDIGIANSNALIVANEVFRAVETIGLPECGITLAHGVTYLARSPKDRSSYDAYKSALADAKQLGNLPIPLKLRNAETGLMKEMGYGEGYEMYGYEGFLPEQLEGKKYFTP
jgi:putative ATPase